ncbi:hemagglutinin repeat-containing protein [Yersinia enterocolitica]|uniref:hemagglutinin repeat-containing protein n=1 Tax=Yersinia enterocolitica TaxID=630 RepID=UPI0005E675D4|nr:hemagglutinin repeat-containing protein [Yersinia enterocolitica]EKN3576082.1 hemagglutinin repeat-containing protein [Yersinia enterocolitica]EKN3580120.1 hemagglutinin repeat-containing protein [Yersinia enterocolitica]EKN4088555.1 hemagglutinin repeat-containing protein [Yersinia enterocolitica]EKN4096840.1 hemagglutinin repeat-containing protein [Yersinia enterocolitica]EKN4756974.1 hemagglutinin repeat-containing protein [Yersinia enterocolitica]
MKQNKFRLSPAGKLAAAVAIISVSVATCYAAGIVGAGDPAHNPGINSVNGVTVVDIVKPSASGLSHNQYNEFNVNKAGAVFNNSLNAGQSQLAGQLSANQNLNGQAASIILNEVISRNPSLLLGKQEVFGMAADYILANPNGITCNSCGFLNTNRTSLVVGNPLVDQGNLQGFDTRNNTNLLEIGNGYTIVGGSLDLIAPRINMLGTVDSKEGINIILGQNKVGTDGEILASQKYVGSAYDSKIFGGMMAGRIRIINTAEGNGVNMSSGYTGRESIDISTPGTLNLDVDSDPELNYNPTPASLSGKNITINAGDIFTSGDIIETSANGSTTQTLERTKIKGSNISIIAKKKNHLDAAIIDGKNIVMHGGNIQLNAEKLTNTHTDGYSEGGGWWLSEWSKSKDNKNEQQTTVGTTIIAENNVSLQSTKGDIKLSGTSIKAGNNLSIKAKKDLNLAAVVDQESTQEKGHHYVNSNKDITWDNKTTTQTLNKATLQAGGNMGLTAEGNISANGVQASAGGDLLINANEVKIDVQKTKNQKTTKGRNEQNLGLGGIDHNNNDKNAEVSHRSEITAEGNILVVGNKGVSITGSKVKADKDGYVQAAEGGIKIDNAVSITTTKIDERTGVAFNITGSSHKANNSDEKITGSELVSDANLKIIAKDNVDIIGSLVKSAGELGIETLGEVNVKAAQAQQKIDEQKTKLTISGFTNDDGKNQYQAGLKLNHTSESEKTNSSKNHGASLEGNRVKVDAQKDVTFIGSNLTATTGDADIKGENVSFVATQDTLSSNKTKETVGVDFHYTGGMDKAGSGVNVNYEDTQTTSDKSTAVVSDSKVAGNLNISASKDITNQGTDHNVGGDYQAQGNNIHNLAAENSEITNTKTTKVDVGYEANIAYGEVTRPIEGVINKAQELDLGGMIEAVGEVGGPNAGLDLYAKGGTKETHLNSSQAVVTSIKSGNITLNANGEVKDQGTKYQADKGAITLDASRHTFEAAANRVDQHITETQGGADVRIYTTTGKDITVDGKGKGGSTDQHVKGDIAQVGSMNAANGVNINVKEDAIYQGTNINAGSGKTKINAGGDIHFDQVTHHTSESHNNVEANAKANIGTNVGSKNFGAGLGGGNSKGQSSTSVAQVSQLQGQQGIELNAGKDLTLTGTTFGNKDQATGDIQLIAGNKVDVLAAQSHGSKQDITWSASANAGISKSTGTDKNGKGISAGAEVKVANKDESALKHQGSMINSNGTVTVKAGSHDNQAIHMQNANITSQKTTLTADNGGILLESAQDKEHKNNWKFTVGANGNQNSSFNKDDKGVVDKQSSGKLHNISAELDVGVEQLDAVIQQNTHINSNNIVLNSAKDTALSGGILKASNMTGIIGGDLKVQSREDSRHEVNVNTGFGFNHSNEKQDSLITQAAEMSPIGSDKVKKTLTTKSNKLFDKVKKQYDQISSKFTTKEEDNVKTLSYTKEGKKMTLDESTSEEETKDKWWQKGAKAVGKKVKGNVQDEQVKGGNGKAKIEVEVVDNKAVTEQSAISGTQSVNLNVAGKTELIGGKISSQDSDVNLQTNGLELQDINGKHTQGGARVNASTKITETIGSGVGEMMEGKTPVLGAHGGSEQKNAVAGVTRG